MTEDEAKTKWCPESRTHTLYDGADGTAPAHNRWYSEREQNSGTGIEDMGEIDHEFRCIGSACMAWRWNTTTKISADQFNGLSQRSLPEIIVSTTHGYCGKAGRP